jgi:hypothetical protein
MLESPGVIFAFVFDFAAGTFLVHVKKNMAKQQIKKLHVVVFIEFVLNKSTKEMLINKSY